MKSGIMAQALTVGETILTEFPEAKAYFVGGCVRDHLLSRLGFDNPDIKDADIEVFGVPQDKLLAGLEKHYNVDLVGKSFGVMKLKGMPVDISLPRTEVCIGEGHKDFQVIVDHTLPLQEAAKRRDFTINAMYFSINEYNLVDPYNGEAHLKARMLHPVSEKFEEDALRVLRAMQFIARFDLIPTHDLVRRCQKLSHSKLALVPKERVLEEWKKLLLKGIHIGKGLEFLVHSEVLWMYPELEKIIGVRQHPQHHPEGCVWTHTKHCLDALPGTRTGVEADDLAVAFSVLGHDFGKATTTREDVTGKITAYGHESASVPFIRSFMERMYDTNSDLIPLVEKLVENHMRPVAIYNTSGTISALRRCSVAVDGRLDLLMKVVFCDQSGRPPKVPTLTAIDWVHKPVREASMSVSSKIEPIVKGRHLIETFKLTPGPSFKPILDDAFQAQLDGKFSDLEAGLDFVKQKLAVG